PPHSSAPAHAAPSSPAPSPAPQASGGGQSSAHASGHAANNAPPPPPDPDIQAAANALMGTVLTVGNAASVANQVELLDTQYILGEAGRMLKRLQNGKGSRETSADQMLSQLVMGGQVDFNSLFSMALGTGQPDYQTLLASASKG